MGELEGQVLFLPGHTLAMASYVIGDATFVHDTLLMPDFGTVRADFPGCDARAFHRCLECILELPDASRLLLTGHDVMPGGREPRWQPRVAEQRAGNSYLQGMDEDASWPCATPATGACRSRKPVARPT